MNWPSINTAISRIHEGDSVRSEARNLKIRPQKRRLHKAVHIKKEAIKLSDDEAVDSSQFSGEGQHSSQPMVQDFFDDYPEGFHSGLQVNPMNLDDAIGAEDSRAGATSSNGSTTPTRRDDGTPVLLDDLLESMLTAVKDNSVYGSDDFLNAIGEYDMRPGVDLVDFYEKFETLTSWKDCAKYLLPLFALINQQNQRIAALEKKLAKQPKVMAALTKKAATSRISYLSAFNLRFLPHVKLEWRYDDKSPMVDIMKEARKFVRLYLDQPGLSQAFLSFLVEKIIPKRHLHLYSPSGDSSGYLPFPAGAMEVLRTAFCAAHGIWLNVDGEPTSLKSEGDDSDDILMRTEQLKHFIHSKLYNYFNNIHQSFNRSRSNKPLAFGSIPPAMAEACRYRKAHGLELPQAIPEDFK